MTRRSRAREVALQLLFQRDVNPNVPRSAVEEFVRERLLKNDELVTFCLSLYDGVVTHASDIDKMLSAAAENWRLPRMAAVDRNVLRLELVRHYGSQDSPAFVNGILDHLLKSREPADVPTP